MSRKIDALVAEHVMGWERSRDGSYIYPPADAPTEVVGRYKAEFDEGWPYWTPHYSTSVAAAWEVVEKIGGSFQLITGPKDYEWACGFGGSPPPWTFNDSAPMAICLAALRAKGVEVG